MTLPITPEEVAQEKEKTFPAFVFQAFNFEIAKRFVNGEAVVLQKDVVEKIKELGDVSADSIYSSGWLNIEESYKKAGWVVEYDKPGYNENYAATFTFRKRK